MSERCKELLAALIWCSAAEDFQVGGKARKGWIKVSKLISASCIRTKENKERIDHLRERLKLADEIIGLDWEGSIVTCIGWCPKCGRHKTRGHLPGCLRGKWFAGVNGSCVNVSAREE